tara:strand:- start:762 stop:1217 length:456 start_codon:yes stop_codon:yes gene_type:complete
MSKLKKAFGDTESLRVKTFTLADHVFKVRVPLSKDMDAIQERMSKVDETRLAERYAKISAPFLEGTTIDGIEVTEDDIMVEGRSMKELAKTVLQMENRVLEYVKLLVPETGSLSDITYQEIEEEFPIQVQMELIEKIAESIQPGYRDVRKN